MLYILSPDWVFYFIKWQTSSLKNLYLYCGRQITMDWVYVNPFSGYVHFKNLKIYEYKSDSIFISLKGLSGTIAVHKLFSKIVEVNNFTLDQPRAIVVQAEHSFNFSDFATTFSSKN